MSNLDHMNAHLHADGSVGYWHPCDTYCKDEAAVKVQPTKRKRKDEIVKALDRLASEGG